MEGQGVGTGMLTHEMLSISSRSRWGHISNGRPDEGFLCCNGGANLGGSDIGSPYTMTCTLTVGLILAFVRPETKWNSVECDSWRFLVACRLLHHRCPLTCCR